MGDASLEIVRRVLAAYLAAPGYTDPAFAAEHQALPLYAGWTGTTYLTVTGEFWFRNCEYDPPRIERDIDEASKIVALLVASERYPQLAALLPSRPADENDCDACAGRGRITIANGSNVICGRCNGLGWLSRYGSSERYPTFAEALVEFQRFLAAHGYSDQTVFVSPDHAIVLENGLYLTPDAIGPEICGMRDYELAVARRLGVALGAVGELPDGRSGIYVYGPSTENEAERLMYPHGLKMMIPERRTRIQLVGSWRMKWLRFRFRRWAAERTREYFR